MGHPRVFGPLKVCSPNPCWTKSPFNKICLVSLKEINAYDSDLLRRPRPCPQQQEQQYMMTMTMPTPTPAKPFPRLPCPNSNRRLLLLAVEVPGCASEKYHKRGWARTTNTTIKKPIMNLPRQYHLRTPTCLKKSNRKQCRTMTQQHQQQGWTIHPFHKYS